LADEFYLKRDVTSLFHFCTLVTELERKIRKSFGDPVLNITMHRWNKSRKEKTVV